MVIELFLQQGLFWACSVHKSKQGISCCSACNLYLVATTERSAGDLSPTATRPHPHAKEPRDTTELATALLIGEAERAHSLIFRSRIGCALLTVMKICICQFIKLTSVKRITGDRGCDKERAVLQTATACSRRPPSFFPQILQLSAYNLLAIKLIWGSARSSSTGITIHQYYAEQDQYWQFHTSGYVKF